MRVNLAQACLSIAFNQPVLQCSSISTDAKSILDSWVIRLHALGLIDQLQPDRANENDLPQALLESCTSSDAAMRREALITLSQVVQEQGLQGLPWVTAQKMWYILKQALGWEAASEDPALLVSAINLAGAIAYLTYTGKPRGSLQEAVHSFQDKRRCLADLEPRDPASRDPAGQELPPGCEASRLISVDHALATHDCLVGWCSHWHPRVRRAALQGLLAAHTGAAVIQVHPPCSAGNASLQNHRLNSSISTTKSGTISIQHSASIHHSTFTLDAPPAAHELGSQCVYLCSSPDLVEAAYGAAVTALADDSADVRCLALRLVAGLAGTHAAVRLPGARWLQLGQQQALSDDAFQRLCCGVRDGDAEVRQLSLELLAGVHAQSLRVKLQALSKKATISVSVPVSDSASASLGPATAATSKQQQQHQGKRGQHQVQGSKQKGGGGGDGGRQGRNGQLPDGLEPAWCGPPGARGLPLLDVSIGALVHGTEDEDWRVRTATVVALLSLARHEVHTLAAWRQPQGVAAGSRGQDLSGSQQVLSQCTEYLCDLLQDEVVQVRWEAVSALAQLVDLAAGRHKAACVTETSAGGSSPCQSPSQTAAADNTTQPAWAHSNRSDADAQQAVVILDGDQVLVVLGCLSDPHKDIRSVTRQLLSRLNSWPTQLTRALALAAAHAVGLQPGQEAQQVLELVRLVAAKAPNVAKNVATSIAKQQTSEQQVGSSAHGGNSQPLPAQAKHHLLVMKALLQGSNNLLTPS